MTLFISPLKDVHHLSNRFASVRQVHTFARFCHERGIVLHFVAEPYLDMGNGKQWRPAVAKVIASMVESEQKAKGMMISRNGHEIRKYYSIIKL